MDVRKENVAVVRLKVRMIVVQLQIPIHQTKNSLSITKEAVLLLEFWWKIKIANNTGMFTITC